jgi:YHS domain-containing protein
MTKLTTLFASAIMLGGILGGCSEEAPAEGNTTEPTSSIEGGTVVFANDKGEPMCPVMGAPMASTEGLQYQDYEGKRYYFCCGDCPEKFKADPAKYADGKAMPADSTM